MIDINKRGEKELQMIFGLFILLIITLVVLNLFLQSSKKGFGQVEKSSQQELKSQQTNRLKLNCQALCDNINDVNTAIEFCGHSETLEQDNDKTTVANKARYGQYEFCTNKIPCFLVIDNCQSGAYTGFKCKSLLLQQPATYDIYTKLTVNVNSKIGDVTDDDGCGLTSDSADPSYASNWKAAFCYNEDINTAAARIAAGLPDPCG